MAATVRASAAALAGSWKVPCSVWKTTWAVVPARSGKRWTMRSSAFWDSTPGTLNWLLSSPPDTFEMPNSPTAATSHTSRTSLRWRTAAPPSRWRNRAMRWILLR